MAAGFQDIVEGILREDTRYDRDAYGFVRDALESTLKRRKKNRGRGDEHVSAEELLEGFRLHALQEFGPMTVTVLGYWGIRSCEDVGNIVWALIEAGAFGRRDEDSPEAFRRGFDFEEAFVRPFRPEGRVLSAEGIRAVESPR